MRWIPVVLAVAACRNTDEPRRESRPEMASPAAASALVPRGTLTTNDHDACAIEASGKVACWNATDRAAPVEIGGLTNAAGLAGGAESMCAWTTGGDVLCWGDDERDNRAGDHHPRVVPHVDGVIQVVAGLFGACGLRANGHVACWPAAAWQDPLWPRVEDAVGVSGAVEIAGDDSHLCARLTTGEVSCVFAPDNHHEERFAVIPELTGATSIGGSDDLFAALLPGHRLAIWNIADYEQRTSHPAQVHWVSGVTGERVVVGGRHVCVVGATTRCWSVNDLDPPSAEVMTLAQPLPAGVRDVALGRDLSCARIGDHPQCWPTLAVPPQPAMIHVDMGAARVVTPAARAPDTATPAIRAPTELAGRPMLGPYKTAEAACRAQRCPDRETETFCFDEAAQGSPIEFMKSPPAPFTEVRIVAFDCRNPDNQPDSLSRLRLLIERPDGVWLSEPLVVAGAKGQLERCSAVVAPRWEARALATAHDVVLSLVAGTSCHDDKSGSDDEVSVLVVAADAAKPVVYPPLVTAVSQVRTCASGCTPVDTTVQLVPTFVPEGVALDGPATWPAIRRSATGGIDGLTLGHAETSTVGTYHFTRP